MIDAQLENSGSGLEPDRSECWAGFSCGAFADSFHHLQELFREVRDSFEQERRLPKHTEHASDIQGEYSDKDHTRLDFKIQMHLLKSNQFDLKVLSLRVHLHTDTQTESLIDVA